MDWISGAIGDDGSLDMSLNWSVVQPYFWMLLLADFGVFLLLLLFGESSLAIGIPLFTLWSVLTGFELALCLVSVDENLGCKVLALTALITLAAGLVGAKSGIDFSMLNGVLFISLLMLILFGLVRIFFSIPRWIQRVSALFGVIVFIGYLMFDFNRLHQLNDQVSANTWAVAMRISIKIYLDIINLFLDLLDLLSK